MEKKKEIKDQRFQKIFNDPKFIEVPELVRRIELKDKRFNHMFTNKSFNDDNQTDQYGHKIKSTLHFLFQ